MKRPTATPQVRRGLDYIVDYLEVILIGDDDLQGFLEDDEKHVDPVAKSECLAAIDWLRTQQADCEY